MGDRSNRDLAGIWCCDGGGWNGYALILRPDGVGRAEMSNCFLTNAWLFDWKLEGDHVVFRGREAVELNEAQDGIVHLSWKFDESIGITIGSVAIENGEARRTLSLASPLVDCLPLKYVAGNPRYDLFAKPDFGWVHGRRN